MILASANRRSEDVRIHAVIVAELALDDKARAQHRARPNATGFLDGFWHSPYPPVPFGCSRF